MTNSQNETSKCLSGILRGLLCTGSLPTHPSDSISAEPNTTTNRFKKNNTTNNPEKDSKNELIKPQVPPTPGIVARLMGLETLPDFNWSQNRTTLDSILRSRSVNSVTYLPQFDLTQFNHRRVRTSVSFREENTTLFQQRENDFVVFRFDKVGGSTISGLSGEKSMMGVEEWKQREIETEGDGGDLGERRYDDNQKKKKNKVVFGVREKEKNYRVKRRFSSKVDNVSLPHKSIPEIGLEELKQRAVKTERNRENSGERMLLERKKKKERVNRRFSSKVDNVNLPNKVKSEMGFEELMQRKVEPERSRGNLGERNSEKKKVSERKGERNGVGCGKDSSKVYNADLIRKNKAIRDKTQETVKGKSVVKALNNKEIVSFREKKKSVPKHPDKKVQPLCNSNNSSPVSVLDLQNISRRPQITSSEYSMELSCSSIGSSCDRALFVDEKVCLKPKKTRKMNVVYCSQVLNEIFRLTEEGVQESKWIIGDEKLDLNHFKDVEEICNELGQQILDDLLLSQVIHELACGM